MCKGIQQYPITTKVVYIKDKFQNSGFYQLNSIDRCKTCMEQTGSSFEINFQEHFLALNNNDYNSEYSQHILENCHCFGKIEDMKVVFYYKKERHICTVENLHIYKETIRGNQTTNTLLFITLFSMLY